MCLSAVLMPSFNNMSLNCPFKPVDNDLLTLIWFSPIKKKRKEKKKESLINLEHTPIQQSIFPY